MPSDPDETALIFLKLGGSLITQKDRPHTARPDVLREIALQIASAWRQQPSRRILLGHGSGSFAHVPAQKYGTRQGVHSQEDWRGFTQVWREASDLNRMVIESFHETGLPAISFPPSASLIAQNGQVETWEIGPIRSALQAGLLPVVFGDVIFDRLRGGTIFSTEDLFGFLAPKLKPQRILLAGIEPGVWKDYPVSSEFLPEITPAMLPALRQILQGSAATDVTGGMASKVLQSLELIRQMPDLEVVIFSGDEPKAISQALSGERVGTLIHRG